MHCLIWLDWYLLFLLPCHLSPEVVVTHHGNLKRSQQEHCVIWMKIKVNMPWWENMGSSVHTAYLTWILDSCFPPIDKNWKVIHGTNFDSLKLANEYAPLLQRIWSIFSLGQTHLKANTDCIHSLVRVHWIRGLPACSFQISSIFFRSFCILFHNLLLSSYSIGKHHRQ